MIKCCSFALAVIALFLSTQLGVVAQTSPAPAPTDTQKLSLTANLDQALEIQVKNIGYDLRLQFRNTGTPYIKLTINPSEITGIVRNTAGRAVVEHFAKEREGLVYVRWSDSSFTISLTEQAKQKIRTQTVQKIVGIFTRAAVAIGIDRDAITSDEMGCITVEDAEDRARNMGHWADRSDVSLRVLKARDVTSAHRVATELMLVKEKVPGPTDLYKHHVVPKRHPLISRQDVINSKAVIGLLTTRVELTIDLFTAHRLDQLSKSLIDEKWVIVWHNSVIAHVTKIEIKDNKVTLSGFRDRDDAELVAGLFLPQITPIHLEMVESCGTSTANRND